MCREKIFLIFADRKLREFPIFRFDAIPQFVELDNSRGIGLVLQVRRCQTLDKPARDLAFKRARKLTIASSLFRSSSPDVR